MAERQLGAGTTPFEQQIAQYEGEWRKILIENAPEIVMGCDSEDRLLEWNQEAERALGWSRDEAAGTMLRDLIFPEFEKQRWTEVIEQARATYLRQCLYRSRFDRWIKERLGYDPRRGWRQSYE